MYEVVKRKVSTSLPKKEREIREGGNEVTEERRSEWRNNKGKSKQ
jgi:hypothetical protein